MLFAHQAAVAVERGDADQLGDLSLVHEAQSGRPANRKQAVRRPMPFERHEHLRLPAEFRVRLEAGRHLLDSSLALVDAEAQGLLDPAFCGIRQLLATVLLLHDHVGQLSVAQDKILQHGQLAGMPRQDPRLNAPAVVSQDKGVDPVGLGELAAGFRELPDLLGVHLGERQSGRLQGRHNTAFVAGGRLEDQPLDPLEERQKGDEGSDALSRVRKARLLSIRQMADVEGRFGSESV